jgi:hypothetical protein
MVGPVLQPPFSAGRSEDAVAFAEAGNAILSKNRQAVNAVNKRLKCGLSHQPVWPALTLFALVAPVFFVLLMGTVEAG